MHAKFQNYILKNHCRRSFWIKKTTTFQGISGYSHYFSYFQVFVRFRFEKTCYRVIFRVRYENLIHKHALNHIKVENISLTFLDLVTLDDLDLT